MHVLYFFFAMCWRGSVNDLRQSVELARRKRPHHAFYCMDHDVSGSGVRLEEDVRRMEWRQKGKDRFFGFALGHSCVRRQDCFAICFTSCQLLYRF